MPQAIERIGIPELLTALRDDIEAAQSKMIAAGRAPMFALDAAEVEIQFTVSASNEAAGGFKLDVIGFGFELGGKDTGTNTFAHRVKIALKPMPGNVIGTAGGTGKS